MTEPQPTIRLVLTEEQSADLIAAGVTFAAIGPGSYPGAVGRMCLYVVPCGQLQAAQALMVATGKAKITITKPKP
jgi:ABC-type arginine transport system permease subunit